MMKLLKILCLSATTIILFITLAFAGDGAEQIRERASVEHWVCKDVAELGEKYDVDRKLPEAEVAEGQSCAKSDVMNCLLSVIDKVLKKSENEGRDAIPREDLGRLARLHDALRSDLANVDDYRNRREAIEKMLAKPEEPPFMVKAGVKGFTRGEGAGNFRLSELGSNPGHAEGRFLYRVLPYIYWHPTDYLDIHLEGQGYGYTGGSQYLGKISLYQGFVEGRLPGSDLLALKTGRQEFVYGSAFILGSDSFFKGLTFDAARLRAKPHDALTVDLLGGWYATPWSDGVRGNLVGGYASYELKEGTVLEAYGFNDTGSPEHHSGEYLNTWGLRATAKIGPVSFEIEPVYESGRVFNGDTLANDRINAWGGHADVTLEAELFGRENIFFASYAYGSGSREKMGREFRNPNTDTSLTGDMSMVGDLSGVDVGDYHASGLQIFNLGWGIELAEKLNFSGTGRYFYANAVPDGFSRRIGLETDFTVSYALNDNFSLLVGYDRFFTGKFFRDANNGGGDIDYGYVMLQFDLAKSWPRPRKG